MLVTQLLGYLENLNHDLAESLNLYATPRTHPPVRGRTCKVQKSQSYKLSKVVSIWAYSSPAYYIATNGDEYAQIDTTFESL